MNLVEYVHQQEQLFLPVISDSSIKWERESQFCIQAIQNNDYLAKIAKNNPASFQNAIINVANIGISLNPASKLAYLVPRDGRVCLDVSYMGLLHIATTEGSIEWGQAKIVYANDGYENQGLTKEPIHKYKAFGVRGDAIGCYCTVKLPNGDYMTEEMDKDTIHDIRNRSKGFQSGKSSPWKSDELEMWRKTVVKRASKYWPQPQTSRLDKAVHMLNTESGEGLEEKDITGATDDQILDFVKICDLMEKEHKEALKVISGKDGNYQTPNEVPQEKMENFLAWAKQMLDYKNNFAEPMLQAHASGDEQYIYECIEEITEDDQFYIWRAYTKFGLIPGDTQKEMRNIHAKIKKELHNA